MTQECSGVDKIFFNYSFIPITYNTQIGAFEIFLMWYDKLK